MPEIVGIRFKNCGRIYDFEGTGDIRKGDRVIVESEFGLGIGTVVVAPRQIEDPARELKKIIRVANEDDLRQKRENAGLEIEARSFCNERIMARGLPMKLVCSEVTLDRKRVIFFFTAEGRIDFRELVKDLAAKFKTRIEMRQIGVRDKAKMVGGLGLCGKELCCKLFLTSFEPISIKMAKQQELVLNTGKLSGICGRLMCCLGYEYNEGVEGTSVRTCEKDISTGAGAVADLSEESLVDAEVECCTELQSSEVPSSQPAKQDDKKKGEGFRKHRRRRRYRKKTTKNE